MSTNLVLRATLPGTYYYEPHFLHVETDVREDKCLAQVNRKAKFDPRSVAGLISIFMFCLFLRWLDGS